MTPIYMEIRMYGSIRWNETEHFVAPLVSILSKYNIVSLSKYRVAISLSNQEFISLILKCNPLFRCRM